MRKTVIIHPKTSTPGWCGLSLLLLFGFFLITLLLAICLNTGSINRVTIPLYTYLDLFHVIWKEHPLGAVLFPSNKSLFSLAYYDARSQLNLWALEYDAITLLVYLLTAWLTASVINRGRKSRTLPLGLLYGLSGAACLVSAVTYMTNIAHCAGPTWIGFAAYYGLGHENFEHYPYWQILLAVSGIWLLLREWFRQRSYL